MVSVPYRGFIILNPHADKFKFVEGTGFRPLSGLYYSKSVLSCCHLLSSLVSVPYRGFIILNAPQSAHTLTMVPVSVPYRGFIILNAPKAPVEEDDKEDCFRPLSGLYYSKLLKTQ